MLHLTKFRPEHRGVLLYHLTFPSITSSLPGYSPSNRESWADFIMSDPHCFAIELNDLMIGAARLHKADNCDLSYWLHPSYRGKGYATRVNNDLCYRATVAGWSDITVTCHHSNIPSQNVLRRPAFTQVSADIWSKLLNTTPPTT